MIINAPILLARLTNFALAVAESEFMPKNVTNANAQSVPTPGPKKPSYKPRMVQNMPMNKYLENRGLRPS